MSVRASKTVVDAVMRELGCFERGGRYQYCGEHGGSFEWGERGCPAAVRAADAALTSHEEEGA